MFSLFRRIHIDVMRWWCHAMHPAPMWPVGGMYQCPRCFRKYPVPWEKQRPAAEVVQPPKDQSTRFGALAEAGSLTGSQSPKPHAV